MSTSSEKIQSPMSEFALVCRGCLTYANPMKNMYEWGLAEDFFRLTDVEGGRDEGISELLCAACEETLRVCKSFRLQCLESDMLLRNTAKKKTPDPGPDIPLEVNISHILDDDKLTIYISLPDSQDKIQLPCPYDCKGEYQKKYDLKQHLIKLHQKPKDYCVETRFYCTAMDCSYNAGSERQKWFSERKFLNQHYKKVHRRKLFQCRYCSEGFSAQPDYRRHMTICNLKYPCEICNTEYKNREKYLVHLLRKHPDLHKKYKAEKRKSKLVNDSKKAKNDEKFDFCDSPKRTFATQTLSPEDTIKNDVALPSWQSLPGKSEDEIKRDEISTQTVFEDLLSLKSQTSEDEIYFSETVSLSDIQTQTFPVEFGLSRSNKETLTNETQSPDLSIKETQTCLCLYDSPKFNYKLFDSISSSPSSLNLTSTETQTSEFKSTVKSDVLLSFNSAETQTSDELNDF
ncbi:uncharacterized protein LOC115450085 [Manduca sexta]|uniref:uncharacterized protein LOC115450085 n=1 Tax=Manduca sexta TaxID=7130 RepID=UPI00188E8987|nr:uncharacterized protein LOC115450085 [Manduca sexta]